MAWIDQYLEKKLDEPIAGDKDWIRYNCRFCPKAGRDEDVKHHLYVNIDQFRCICFRCGYAGTLTRLVSDLEGKKLTAELLTQLRDLSIQSQIGESDFQTALRTILSENLDDELNINHLEAELPQDYEPITRKLSSWYERRAFSYLSARGLDMEAVLQNRIGFARAGRYENMIIFPVLYEGRVVYYTTRTIGNYAWRQKSLNPSKDEIPYGRNLWLYNYDNVRECHEVTIVEGPMDALMTPGAVALLGKMMSRQQLAHLAHLKAEKFTVCLDPDALTEAERVAALLDTIGETRLVVLPSQEDPASVGGRIHDSGTVCGSRVDLLHLQLRTHSPNVK